MNLKLLVLTLLLSSLSYASSAQEITVFSGFFGYKYYQDDKQISKNEVKDLMRKDPRANEYWTKSVNHQAIGLGLLGVELGLAIWQTQKLQRGEEQIGPFIGVLATGVASIGFTLSANKFKRKAILAYNEHQDMGSLKLGPTQNGLGLVFQW